MLKTETHHAKLIVHQENENRRELIEKYLLPFFPKEALHLNNPDLFWYHPQRDEYGIDLIREITQKLSLKPYQYTHKVVVIENAEKLTVEAQNALLKTLEEPEAHSLLLLIVNHKDNLLPTVVSRCEINFHVEKSQTNAVNAIEFTELQHLLSKNIMEKFAWVEKNVEEKEIALQTLKKWLRLYRQQMLQEIKNEPNNLEAICTNITHIEKTLRIIDRTNVNLRLALDVLVIKLQPYI